MITRHTILIKPGKPARKPFPTGSVLTEDSPLWHRSAPPGLDAIRAGHLKSAEALRRKAYLRLARTIGVSWLGIRRAALKR